MLFTHAHIGNRHAPVYRLAHVVNRQQGYLYGGEGFYFYTGWTNSFYRGVARDAGAGRIGFKTDGHAGQCQRVAQGNQVTGFFGCHDAGNSGDAQYIAFFGGALKNERQRGSIHHNASLRQCNAVRGGFAAYVNHVRLTLRVKMGQRGSVCHAVMKPLQRCSIIGACKGNGRFDSLDQRHHLQR